MTAPILIINPNSSELVTQGIRTAVAALGPHFEAVDIPHSPATIASDEDVARAGLEVLAVARGGLMRPPTSPPAFPIRVSIFCGQRLEKSRSAVRRRVF